MFKSRKQKALGPSGPGQEGVWGSREACVPRAGRWVAACRRGGSELQPGPGRGRPSGPVSSEQRVLLILRRGDLYWRRGCLPQEHHQDPLTVLSQGAQLKGPCPDQPAPAWLLDSVTRARPAMATLPATSLERPADTPRVLATWPSAQLGQKARPAGTRGPGGLPGEPQAGRPLRASCPELGRPEPHGGGPSSRRVRRVLSSPQSEEGTAREARRPCGPAVPKPSSPLETSNRVLVAPHWLSFPKCPRRACPPTAGSCAKVLFLTLPSGGRCPPCPPTAPKEGTGSSPGISSPSTSGLTPWRWPPAPAPLPRPYPSGRVRRADLPHHRARTQPDWCAPFRKTTGLWRRGPGPRGRVPGGDRAPESGATLRCSSGNRKIRPALGSGKGEPQAGRRPPGKTPRLVTGTQESARRSLPVPFEGGPLLRLVAYEVRPPAWLSRV